MRYNSHMKIDFIYEDNSIKVEGLPLWLDSSGFRSDKSRVRRPLNFISHAHADHLGRHRRIICSKATLDLAKVRQKVEESIVLDWGEKQDIAGATISLYPAGHVLGSAMILIEKDGTKILYTGDFRSGKGLTTEECLPVECDTLLMECTYGQPKYAFPPREDLLPAISEFVEGCFDDSVIPVILGYSLGKAQEAMMAMEMLGFGTVVHPAIWKLSRIYEKHGVKFPKASLFGQGPIGRRVVIFPPNKTTREKVGIYGSFRTAILSGWATEAWRAKMFGADAAIAYSDHSDFEQLVDFASKCGASKVLAHHGETEKFAGFLQARGINGEPLIPSDQGKLF
jgi:putative mRNA 3-end processing factor